jgi:hypothetical protein
MRMRVVGCALMLAAVCGCNGKKIADADLYNVQARLPTGLPAGLPYGVLEWKAITTVVDRGSEMTSTLFGNDAAVVAARAGTAYPAGAVLGLVTWRQREDPHWFGARIPGAAVSVEFVVVGATTACRRFTGAPLREGRGCSAERVAEIEGMKAAWMP